VVRGTVSTFGVMTVHFFW